MDSVPFHGASVHFLFVVEQAVGCAGDRNGGIQAQRFSCGQNQLTLQLQFVVLRKETQMLQRTLAQCAVAKRTQDTQARIVYFYGQDNLY